MYPTSRRIAETPCSLLWAASSQASRQRLESCVARVYASSYDARISHFHDLLLGATNAQGELLGVIGATAAKSAELFLESYMREPVEMVLAHRTGRSVQRGDIFEVGNLAAERAGAARGLVTSLAENLRERGTRWVVLTGTTRVRHILRKLGAKLVDLGPAEGSDLGAAQGEWGRYYEHDPRIVAVELAPFCASFERDTPLSQRLRSLWTRARLGWSTALPIERPA